MSSAALKASLRTVGLEGLLEPLLEAEIGKITSKARVAAFVTLAQRV